MFVAKFGTDLLPVKGLFCMVLWHIFMVCLWHVWGRFLWRFKGLFGASFRVSLRGCLGAV